ncbi:MAG: 4'-phosphopantetheinyl transferase superfamily protein [Elusimicrobia bacterium]|nr:4'-phosphopantetheinyl transferase superfamily protein [Elusimicrobiota bacterium]
MSLFIKLVPVAGVEPEHCALLTPKENRMLMGFKIRKRQAEWLAGRMAAKRALVEALGSLGHSVKPQDIEVLPDSSGRPLWSLTNADASAVPVAAACSLSHSGEWAIACASIASRRLGIDIEKIEDRHPAWFEEAFHPAERAGIISIEAAADCWAQKEALLKFLGLGLNCDLWNVRPPLFFGRAKEAHENLGAPAVHMRRWSMGSYRLALAYS